MDAVRMGLDEPSSIDGLFVGSSILRAPVALMDDPGLKQRLPERVTALAVSLIYPSHMFYGTSTEQMANLLATCPNIREVRISSRTLVDLPSRVGHPLPKLRIVNLSSQLGLSAVQITDLLNMVPNLRSADRLPPTLHALDGAALSERRLDRLVLDHWHRTVLPLLFSGHWKTRNLALTVAAPTWSFLEQLYPADHTDALSATRALTLVILESRTGGPDPLLTVFAACRLRRLTLQARAPDLVALLPAALHGVQELELRLMYSTVPHITALVDMLSPALPGTLHSLTIARVGSHVGLLEPLRPVCRAYRIVFSLKE